MSDRPLCTCSTCAQTMERAYKVAQDLLKEKDCVSTLIGVGDALSLAGAAMLRGEMRAMSPKSLSDAAVNERAEKLMDELHDTILDHITDNVEAFNDMCEAIYDATDNTTETLN